LNDALIKPDWPAPSGVRAYATTRHGGVSVPPWDSLNLGDHVGDDPLAVVRNRLTLSRQLALPGSPHWLEQVHGACVVELSGGSVAAPADGSFSRQSGQVCVVLTADCLPILLCDRGGRAVAALHGGWRGLAAGVLEQGVACFANAGIQPKELLAWLGPAIGAAAYEIDEPVRRAFPDDGEAFTQNPRGRWQLDLAGLARRRLAKAGVTASFGSQLCTFSDEQRFYSHRRDGNCGRQATLIWLEPVASS
jgi:YfiH family protein